VEAEALEVHMAAEACPEAVAHREREDKKEFKTKTI
jgi:hypothetical protein